ncbi:hypothetical protein [Leptospira interrogans]|uniref:hypothetical protein n=1 Tax=Leptospira interrogans TaxID=173 RepID=UPI00031ADCF6|nr:hypothetical protein [Leptospira interrogans]MCR8649326.1 hypothetical protein [Leptospira interrogans serovar Bataviae]OAM74411.1 hypothetical protein A1343_08925 [Leptospira interrogans serovar Bataviae]QOI39132.1 hypothetical protein Lepto1548_13185 [Leptospira interrogans serovar Bataviae]QYY59408.1 hypothetical protein GR153_012230 [Leptospira interrogans serovar Bataviae]
MNPISIGLLYFFGSIAIGIFLGWIIGNYFKFEVGLMLGVFTPGLTSTFVAIQLFFIEYQARLQPGPNRFIGEADDFVFELLNASLVFMLIAVFLISFMIIFLHNSYTYYLQKRNQNYKKNLEPEPEKVPENFLAFLINFIFNIATFGGIPIVTCCAYFWTKDLFFSFQISLGTTAIGILGHAIKALFQRDLSWSFYAFLLCFNFAAWIFALEFFEFM